MSSRRPLLRSFSGNGRYGSLNGDVITAHSMRTETRGTLCSVMAQLAAETQPSFETTLKSKAVSESSNVKFTCVVSGNPTPEVIWYKDDMEMDRYCGLPKYEIFCNGKTHTLHIYNCTEDDAAIYQASARNSKGIVSCSGLLEVGAMNEFRIHQRFFAKLKQKADTKRKDLEQNRRQDVESAHSANGEQPRAASPVRKPRLVRSPSEPGPAAPPPSKPETKPPAPEDKPVEQPVEEPEEQLVEQLVEQPVERPAEQPVKSPAAPPVARPIERPAIAIATPIANGFATLPEPVKERGKPVFLYFGNKVEIVNTRPATKESPTNKAVKASRVDSTEPAGGSAGDGGLEPRSFGKEKEAGKEEMSLARYLTEYSKSESTGTRRNGTRPRDVSKPGPAAGRQAASEKEPAKRKGAPGQGPPGVCVPAVRASAETMGQKAPESPSTLASMFFSLRDMFFRTKNKTEDPAAAAVNGVDPVQVCGTRVEGGEEPSAGPPLPRLEPPQRHQRQASGKTQTPAPQSEPVEVNMPSVEGDVKAPPVAKTQRATPPGNRTPERRLGSEGLSPGVTDRSAAPPLAGTGGGGLTAMPLHLHKPVCTQLPAPDCSRIRETPPTSQQPLETEVTGDRTQSNGKDVPTGRDLSTCQSKQEIQPPAPAAGHVKAGAEGRHILHNYIHSGSGASHNTQIHTNKSQKKYPVGPVTCGCDKTVGPEDVSECPVQPTVKPGQAELPVAAAAVKDGGVSVGAGEIQAGNLRSGDDNAPGMQELAEKGGAEIWVKAHPEKETKMHGGKDRTEMPSVTERKTRTEGKEIPTYAAHENGNRGFPGAQGEKAVTNTSSESAMIVQVKLLEGPQPKKVWQNVPDILRNIQKDGVTNVIDTPEPKPEVIKLQLRVPGAPQVLDRTCSKTSFLKSQIQSKTEHLTPLADNIPTIPEQANLLKDAMVGDPALVMEENTGKSIPVTPIQQTTERKKGLSQQNEIQKAALEDQEVKPGREPENVNSCGQYSMGKANDSTPVKSISIEDNSKLSKTNAEHQLNSVKSLIIIRGPPKVPTFVVPPISITGSDGISPENNEPYKDEVKEDSSATQLQGVMRELESCATLSAGRKREINSTPYCVEDATPTNDSDMPLGISTPEPGVKETPSSVTQSPLEKDLPCADVIFTQPDKEQQQKQLQLTTDTFTDQHVKEKSGSCRSNPMNPELLLLCPTTPHRDPATDTLDMEATGLLAVPAIRVDSAPLAENYSGEGTIGDTFLPLVPACESSPRLRKRDSLTPIRSATPEELALGARRKIFIPKSKMEEVEVSPGLTDALAKNEEVSKRRTSSQEQEAPYMSPSQSRRPSLLQLPAGQQTPPLPRRSPLLGRKKTTLEAPKCPEETVKEPDTIKTDPKSIEKDKLDPLKAPQVMRKIRAEPFPDNTGHLKLCCQFFNVLSNSTLKWCRDETEIAEVNRSAGDESQAALAIVHVSSMDCGVYSCSIKNEYGSDSTDFFLSAAILSQFLLRADLEVGQEIELTPMLFAKGLADPGYWGNKFFGRIMITESHIGDGCRRKACRVKVIYGLEPAFESGSTCIVKVQNPISYGKKDENNLMERNLEITQQECKVQNMVREYCKVFTAEARVAGNFGPVLEVIPLYLIYQPANAIPYATAEADLKGVFLKHSLTDATGRLIMRTGSEVEQMCCTFQHWIHQWTNGNLLLSQLEGVDGKITNVGVATKVKGYQGLSDKATPKVFEQFVEQHQCNQYCSLLGLRSLKFTDSLTTKTKGSRSPMLNRKGSASPQTLRKGSASPQTLRRGGTSPQMPRKVSSSPRMTKKLSEPGDSKPTVINKTLEVPSVASTS